MSDELNKNGIDEEINTSEPKIEENDNWQFEAEALTLNDTLLQNDELEIEIPKVTAKEKVYETREKPKAAPAATEKPVKEKRRIDSRELTVFITVAVLAALCIGALVYFGINYYKTHTDTANPSVSEKLEGGKTVMTIGNYSVSEGMYSYYYAQVVQSCISAAQQGQVDVDVTKPFDEQMTQDYDGNEVSYSKFFDMRVSMYLQWIAAYYDKGVNEYGITLTDEDKSTIEQQISSLKQGADTDGITIDEYLQKHFGASVTEQVVRTAYEQTFIAQKASQRYSTEIHPSDEDVDAYYQEHADEFERIKFACLAIQYTEGERKQTVKAANSYVNDIKTVDDLKKIIPEVCESYIKRSIESEYVANKKQAIQQLEQSIDMSVTRGDNSTFTTEITDWLFSDDTPVGACKVFNLDNYMATLIILKTEEPSVYDDTVYSVRHILIAPETDTETDKDGNTVSKEPTKKQLADAEKKAQEVLDEFNATDRSEYRFSLLVPKYTADTGSASTGGLYENQPLGQNVEEFENWAIDKSRKYGDVEIVKTRFGYHIMFFIDCAPEYLANCRLAVKNDISDKYVDSYTITPDEEQITALSKAIEELVLADFNEQMQSGTQSQQNSAE